MEDNQIRASKIIGEGEIAAYSEQGEPVLDLIYEFLKGRSRLTELGYQR